MADLGPPSLTGAGPPHQDLTRDFEFHQLCGSRISLDSEVLSGLLRLRRYVAEDRAQQGSQGAFRDSATVIVLGS